ncbi:MAG: hypothetical protein FWD58_08240, partial [Firmicutes bacterium]|nr:hypothetical protein [Bacillota bacterium]
RDQGSGVRDQGSGVRDQGSGVRDQGSGVRDQGSGVRDQGSGIRDQGSGIRDQGLGIRGQGSGIRDQGSGDVGRDCPPIAPQSVGANLQIDPQYPRKSEPIGCNPPEPVGAVGNPPESQIPNPDLNPGPCDDDFAPADAGAGGDYFSSLAKPDAPVAGGDYFSAMYSKAPPAGSGEPAHAQNPFGGASGSAQKPFSDFSGLVPVQGAVDAPVQPKKLFGGTPLPASVPKPAGSPAKKAAGDYADRSASGFSFEEALNPKDDLAQIMRDLGLLSED